MKFLYYQITDGEPLQLTEQRAARYMDVVERMKVFKNRCGIADMFGYHFHAFRALRIIGVSFHRDVQKHRGWVHNQNDPHGIFRPASRSHAGKLFQRVMQSLRMDEPRDIFAACQCDVYREGDNAYLPSIGTEGADYVLAVPSADNARHKDVPGLQPLTEAEHAALVQQTRETNRHVAAQNGSQETPQ